MKSSLLPIIGALSRRSAKQFIAPIFGFEETQKPSHYPLKLPSQDVTGEIQKKFTERQTKFVVRWIKYERNFTRRKKSILLNKKEVLFELI